MMGRELISDEEHDPRSRGKVISLMESLRMTYTDSVKEALRKYEFNFVISDPRLPENPIVYVSDGFCKISGYSSEEVLGRNCRFLQGPDTDRRTVLELRDAVREERSAQVRILNYTKEGKPFWNLFHLAPVFSKADGTVIHFVGVQTPMSREVAIPLSDKQMVPRRLSLGPGISQSFPSVGDKLKHLRKKPECPKVDAGVCWLNVFSNSGSKLNGVLSSSCRDMQVIKTCQNSRGIMVSDACKPQEPETLKATNATRSIVSQLVESSKGKGGVLENRVKQLSECTTAGVVSSSLLLSLARIQQSFVLVDPYLPGAPILHASDLFLHLTGYQREEVMGCNCRFLQGPDTDQESVAQIRESIRLEKPCSVRLLNYRKDKRPFWNLLHVSPVRSSGGKVAFFVGVQLQVSAADEEEGTGMSAQMKQLGAVGAVRVAVRSLQGAGLRRTVRSSSV